MIIHQVLVPAPRKITFERIREKAKTPTAGFLVYDILRAPTPTSKAMLIVPGVCGNSSESYIMHLADEARMNGYNVLVVNPTAPAKNNELDELDTELELVDFSKNIYLEQACDQIRACFGQKSQIYATAFSLGSNYLLRHLATHGEQCRCGIKAAMSVSSAFDVNTAAT